MSETEVYQNEVVQFERPLSLAMKRGFKSSCPKCGTGRLFDKYVKVTNQCSNCGEDLHHHRADDLPAYLVVMIIGHIVVAGFMFAEMSYQLAVWQHLLIWIPITAISSLLLLQPVKGAVVGLQWALRMHGFGEKPDYDDPK
ncbi:DUF983 domain-containing protein [Lentilitoribacter sp. EG35]|uniref:DUF983 domain-containing protein n=1 Tax=Lentilitoribacter sp. EG35 TaxID=3234192 RepID=UPI00345F8172